MIYWISYILALSKKTLVLKQHNKPTLKELDPTEPINT